MNPVVWHDFFPPFLKLSHLVPWNSAGHPGTTSYCWDGPGSWNLQQHHVFNWRIIGPFHTTPAAIGNPSFTSGHFPLVRICLNCGFSSICLAHIIWYWATTSLGLRVLQPLLLSVLCVLRTLWPLDLWVMTYCPACGALYVLSSLWRLVGPYWISGTLEFSCLNSWQCLAN